MLLALKALNFFCLMKFRRVTLKCKFSFAFITHEVGLKQLKCFSIRFFILSLNDAHKMNAHVADGVCPFTLSVRLCFNSGTAGRVLMEFVWTLYY
jgi:hypothetical protein